MPLAQAFDSVSKVGNIIIQAYNKLYVGKKQINMDKVRRERDDSPVLHRSISLDDDECSLPSSTSSAALPAAAAAKAEASLHTPSPSSLAESQRSITEVSIRSNNGGVPQPQPQSAVIVWYSYL